MAEGARLESVFRGNSNVGSNPTLSAIFVFLVSATNSFRGAILYIAALALSLYRRHRRECKPVIRTTLSSQDLTSASAARNDMNALANSNPCRIGTVGPPPSSLNGNQNPTASQLGYGPGNGITPAARSLTRIGCFRDERQATTMLRSGIVRNHNA